MAITTCPPEDQLRQLLGGAAPEQPSLVAHLDDCPRCQFALERLADETLGLLGVARRVGQHTDPHAEEDSLRKVLANIQEQITTTRPLSSQDGPPPGVPPQFGLRDGYHISYRLGHGAMGQVLAAFDPALQRQVAIKVLSPNLAGDPVARERFAREARAAAAVKHPHVVTIHAVREDQGLPYLVMELLTGGSLQDYLTRFGAPPWQETARLGAEIAEGLAAAHAAGLVHRDIKPSNILLESTQQDKPGTARIADFGLAQIADESRLTESGILAGTPMYMAPEQALGEPLDERADLFSLGSLLYTLCTGREPFAGGNPMAVLRQVCDATPTPIHQSHPEVPAWLADLITRLHARLPSQRPDSAATVAELLRYNLSHPNRPRSLPRRWIRPRSRRESARLLGVLFLGIVFLAGLVFAINRSRPDNDPIDPTSDGMVLRKTLAGHTGPIWAVAFSPDGQTLVTGSDDTTLRFWAIPTGRVLGVVSDQRSSVLSVAFTPSGREVIVGRGDGALQVWEVKSRRPLPGIPHAGGNPRRLAISPNGKLVAVGSTAQGVELWDFATRKLLRELPGHATTLLTLAFSPDGKTLATGDASGEIRLWDPETGTESDTFTGDPLGLRALAFSPDGQTLASAGTGDRSVKLWKVKSRQLVSTLAEPDDTILRLDFSPRGRRLALGGRDGRVKVWDVPGLQTIAAVTAHQGSVWALDFSPDGHTLVTVGEDRLVKLWAVRSIDPPVQP